MARLRTSVASFLDQPKLPLLLRGLLVSKTMVVGNPVVVAVPTTAGLQQYSKQNYKDNITTITRSKNLPHGDATTPFNFTPLVSCSEMQKIVRQLKEDYAIWVAGIARC